MSFVIIGGGCVDRLSGGVLFLIVDLVWFKVGYNWLVWLFVFLGKKEVYIVRVEYVFDGVGCNVDGCCRIMLCFKCYRLFIRVGSLILIWCFVGFLYKLS